MTAPVRQSDLQNVVRLTDIHIDFETRSEVDLRKTGHHAYAADDSTDVICVAHGTTVDDVVYHDVCGVERYRCPIDIRMAAADPATLFWAHNAAFERAIWAFVLHPRYGWPAPPPPERWRCTMAMAYAQALPGGLEDAGRAVGLEVTKDPGGYQLMLLMCKPKTTYPLTWHETPQQRRRLGLYCIGDVEAEIRLGQRLCKLSKVEQATWALDQRINDRGIQVDIELVEHALKIVGAAQKDLNARIKHLTDGYVHSTNQGKKLIEWLEERLPPEILERLGEGDEEEGIESIGKETVHELLGQPLPGDAPGKPGLIRQVLEVRRMGAKASASKLDALLAGLMQDGRVRGLLQYCAASTGRWGGRRFQPHNLKRPTVGYEVVAKIIKLIKRFGDYGLLELMFGDALEAIGDCMRGVLVAAAGHRLMAGDFSNIEGRVLAWLAGEESKLDVFRLNDAKMGPDPYIIAAGAIYHVDPKTIDKEDPRRQVGKVAELALGFQGGKVAFQKMASGYRVIVTDEEADDIKNAWRAKHPRIVKFWKALEEAAVAAVMFPKETFYAGDHISFKVDGSFLTMRLPSGRRLFYPFPRLSMRKTPWGELKEVVTYMGIDSRSGSPTKGKWTRLSTYGGKLAENATQAAARDCMRDAMLRLDAAGYAIVLHVHDEIVAEVPEGFGSLQEFNAIMRETPWWAREAANDNEDRSELPIAVGGFEAERYRK